MCIKDWEKLPPMLQTEAVRPYYEILKKKRGSLLIKRAFDISVSLLLLIILSPVLLALAIVVPISSKGSVFYQQKRVTQYGRVFRIYKYRTMVQNADLIGSLVTVDGDTRITKIGSFLRGSRLDELPQLLNIFLGDMTFVGTRPEVEKYVDAYKDEWRATLLLPAGVTSKASIAYKDEMQLLNASLDVDATYMNEILPEKMRYNLEAVKGLSLWQEVLTIIHTVFSVLHIQIKL